MEGCKEVWTKNSSDNFQLIQSCFVTHTKKLEAVNFIDEEFLLKKINENDVYVDYGANEDIPGNIRS